MGDPEAWIIKILELEDNKVNRGLLLICSILSPIGLIYLFFHDQIWEFGTFGFILIIFGFSPFLLIVYLRYHFNILKERKKVAVEAGKSAVQVQESVKKTQSAYPKGSKEYKKQEPSLKMLTSKIKLFESGKKILEKDEENFLILALSNFLYTFFVIFLLLISIDLFLINFTFKLFLFSMIFIFIWTGEMLSFKYRMFVEKDLNELRELQILYEKSRE